jgi:hypothetical protein
MTFLKNLLLWAVAVLLLLTSGNIFAQESNLGADFRREKEHVAQSCDSFGLKLITGCAYELFTDHPLHIAAGSMPPQNGFGLGGAFVKSRNTPNWRLSWDVDAVGATSGAWRAGGYMKLVHTPAVMIKPIVPVPGGSSPTKKPKKPTLAVHPYTVFNFYAQTISLNKINFFGVGNDTTLAGASVFGMRQTIIGGNVVKPVFELPSLRKLNFSLIGELNGRFVSVRGLHGQSAPSIESLYSNATAPGLISQPGFVQFGEGVRIDPVIADYLELDYSGKFQQFVVPSNSGNSFSRWTVDLDHTFYLYGYTESAPAKANAKGPDDCAQSAADCPQISRSRNLNGSVGVRLLLSESITSATSAVPFYFQQTLGGADINGALALGSYQDYRFRAPNLLLLQESFEHSIWGPFGVKFMADEGRVAIMRGDLGFSDLKHSFAGGLTLRAGAFPMVSLMFAWGGPEGHHNIFNMNTSLLGGSARPPLD